VTNRIVRSIFVVLLAVAIAMLPASMGVATALPATSGIAAAAQAMPDCEQHHHRDKAPSKQTQKTADHGACVVSCALCFGFVGADVTTIAYAVIPGTALKPARTQDDISSLMGLPPFRPPRT
jgi:hypothetical protein